MLIVRSPVRISFGGGGTDLPSYYETFGGAVVSAAINKYFYTILGNRSDGRVQVISSDLRVCETWHNNAGEYSRQRIWRSHSPFLRRSTAISRLTCFLPRRFLPGTGLGSSASVCVNILKTLTTYLQRPLSKDELAERAFFVTRHLLGKHVGKQDEYAAAFGGLNYISFHPDGTTEVEPVELSPAVLREFQSNLMLFFAALHIIPGAFWRSRKHPHAAGTRLRSRLCTK